jgi:hypothetical protein
VTEATYDRWRQEFGGLKLDQVKRLKELEAREHQTAEGGRGPDLGEADPQGGVELPLQLRNPRGPIGDVFLFGDQGR